MTTLARIIDFPTVAICCGEQPMLRVRERQYFGSDGAITLLSYIRYECKVCERKGALSITEREAKESWEG